MLHKLFLLPGDWVFDWLTKRIGVVKSSNHDASYVWYDRSFISTYVSNDQLKMVSRPSVTFEYENRLEIPYLTEIRARSVNQGLNTVTKEIVRSDIRDEFAHMYRHILEEESDV